MTKLGLAGPIPKKYSRFKVETHLVRSKAWEKRFDAKITTPEDVVEVCQKLAISDRERLIILYLNRKNHISGIQQIAIGTKDASLVPFDAIARSAILSNSSGVIVVHNHPSGELEPSPEDIAAAKKMKEGLETVDIALLDFVIIGMRKDKLDYASLKARGLI